MYIAYSALRSAAHPFNKNDENLRQKQENYARVCSKYKSEIAAIQKYIPNWQPKFNY